MTDRRCSFFAQQCKNRRDGLNDFTIQLVQVTRWQHRLVEQFDLLGVTAAEWLGFVELITELRVSQFFIGCPCKQTSAVIIKRRKNMFIVSDNDVDIIFVTILIPDKGIEGQHLIKPLSSVEFNSI